ncbi:hypothetical protein GUJ93_ZPchr0002g25126 [Zizania palustris]|uniref:Uncharacterized protein n=1 Tax=Zizania palustris TaxID=103762 RepID=A0A8J5RJK4_ZIZPA|nr:hypothetical protein GUJ93_ZPchr0002g25126 [Zizania palustris]
MMATTSLGGEMDMGGVLTREMMTTTRLRRGRRARRRKIGGEWEKTEWGREERPNKTVREGNGGSSVVGAASTRSGRRGKWNGQRLPWGEDCACMVEVGEREKRGGWEEWDDKWVPRVSERENLKKEIFF